MAKTTNTFLKSKLNKDLDARIIPNGEYRDAKNVQISKSEGPNVGSLENVLGNKIVMDFEDETSITDLSCIGYVTDESNNIVYLFLTDYTEGSKRDYSPTANNFIIKYDAFSDTSTTLVKGAFLNFDKASPIYGVNLLENLLFWTDNRNQPRKINVDLARVGSNYHYDTEDQISVAKYNPYQCMDLWQEVDPATTPKTYETTMQDVTSKYYPNGGIGNAEGLQASNATQNVEGFIGDIITGGATGIIYDEGSTVGYITDAGGDITMIAGATVSTAVYDSGTGLWAVTLVGGVWPLVPGGKIYEYIFNPNTYYDSDFAGDPDYLEDKFVRFSYRFKFEDNEYSIMAPFTQVAFIPKQDGYFMYVSKEDLSEVDDQTASYRSTVVSFVENKIDQLKLSIPLPFAGNVLSDNLKVTEMDIIYKESDGLTVKVIDSIPVATISSSSGATSTYEYTYLSKKPYKTLTEDEIVRVYDKVPVKALAQEIASNRIIYGNFQTKHTPPVSLNYNVGVNEKKDFNLQEGTAICSAVGASYPAGGTITIGTVTGTIMVGSIVTSATGGVIIPANTLVTGGNLTTTLELDQAVTLVNPTDLVFTATGPDTQYVSKIEYPNSSVKQNRNYQVGVVLADRYGRQSTVILSSNESSVTTGGSTFIGDTVYSRYLTSGIEQDDWPGNSLKVLFNESIGPSGGANYTSGWPGLYNGDSSGSKYNPLGWYSYKIVVKQTQQEYYNVYLPGIMAAYPEDTTLEIGKTSHTVLINDNINKVPRDLNIVGPDQKQFRSSVRLFGRVENITFTQNFASSNPPFPDNSLLLPGTTNDQYYPDIGGSDIVSTISTVRDLFDYDPVNPPRPNYYPQFYLVDSTPLIARISTRKQIGQIATTNFDVASAIVFADTVAEDPTVVELKNIVGTPVAGMIVTGGGLPEGTTIASVALSSAGTGIINGTQTSVAIGNTINFTTATGTITVGSKCYVATIFKGNITSTNGSSIMTLDQIASFVDLDALTFTSPPTITLTGGSIYSLDLDDVLTMTEAFASPVEPYPLGLQYLAVYETEPVESLLDIYWETSTSGLISDLNNLILNSTGGGAGFSSFNTSSWDEALGSGGDISTDFYVIDNFGAAIPYATVTLTLDSVTNAAGTPVDSYFTLTTDGAADWNIETTANYYNTIYYSTNADLRTFNFNFTTTVNDGTGDVISTQQEVGTVDNVALTISAAVDRLGAPITTGSTVYQNRYVEEIATLDAINGAANANLAWKDVSWEILNVYDTLDLTTDIKSEGYFAITQAAETTGTPVKWRCNLTNTLLSGGSGIPAKIYKITLRASDPASSETFVIFVDMTIVPNTAKEWIYCEECVGGDGCDDHRVVELYVSTSTIPAQNGWYVWIDNFVGLADAKGSGVDPKTIDIDYTNRITSSGGDCQWQGPNYYFSSVSSVAARAMFILDCTCWAYDTGLGWHTSDTIDTTGYNFEIT